MVAYNAEWLKDHFDIERAVICGAQQPCDDAISRREAIKKFTYNHKGERIPDYDCDNFPVQIDIKTVKKILRDLPPVTPQPKMGKWIIVDDCERFIAKCSECGRIEDSRMINKYPYCHCGAKMVEPQESEDKE